MSTKLQKWLIDKQMGTVGRTRTGCFHHEKEDHKSANGKRLVDKRVRMGKRI